MDQVGFHSTSKQLTCIRSSEKKTVNGSPLIISYPFSVVPHWRIRLYRWPIVVVNVLGRVVSDRFRC